MDGEDIAWAEPDRWPAWVTEEVRMAPSDPTWAEQGAAQARRLTDLLGDRVTGPVRHIGSTAVPGLVAKPIIDLAAAAPDRHGTAEWLHDRLGPGWALVPDGLHPLPIRLLVRVVDGRRHTHLQLVAPDDPHLDRLLALRDAMRADPAARAAYAAAKVAAAQAHAEDRGAYTDAKAETIAEILRSVGVTPADR